MPKNKKGKGKNQGGDDGSNASGLVVTKQIGNATVLIDSHQGKHVVGQWPGYSGQKESQFSTGYVSSGDSSFIWDLWDAIWTTISTGGTKQGDILVNCGATVIGTDGQTYVWIQWGSIKNGYSFHAYPIPDEQFDLNKKKKKVVDMEV